MKITKQQTKEVKRKVMCKPKLATFRLPASVCLSAIIGLTTFLLPGGNAQAQLICKNACGASVGCNVLITVAATGIGSGGTARPGDLIRLDFVNVGLISSSCFVGDGSFGNTGTWLAYPNGTTVTKTEGSYTLTQPGQ